MLGRLRSRRPLIATVFAAMVLATTAAHCEAPPASVYPESATFELLNGPVVTAGDTLRFRAGLHEEKAPGHWQVQFTSPNRAPADIYWWTGYPAGECAALFGTWMPNRDPSPEFSVEVECVLPTWVENGTWIAIVLFDRDMVGPTVTFEVTGGSDDQNGPTVRVTEFPTQPIVAGQTFEVAARVSDPNGIALADNSLDFEGGPRSTRPLCKRISAPPYPSFDVEVRWRCTTTTAPVGAYAATITAYDFTARWGQPPTKPSVTII